LDYTDAGAGFLYGYLGSKDKPPFDLKLIENKTSIAYEVAEALNLSKSMNTVFIFKSLSVLYFVSFFLSMFFYLGAMQWVIGKVGWILQVNILTKFKIVLNFYFMLGYGSSNFIEYLGSVFP
jgi:pyrimidine nucleoside transport protein